MEDFVDEDDAKEEQKYTIQQKIEEESNAEAEENKSLGDGMEKNHNNEDKFDSAYYKEKLKQKPTWVVTTFNLSVALIKEK